MASARRLAAAGAAVGLALLAGCGDGGGSSGTTSGADQATTAEPDVRPDKPGTSAPAPQVTDSPAVVAEPFVGGECEGDSIRVEMNTSSAQAVSAGSYPEACEYYCLWVPDSGSQLDIGISGFDVDLDLYVDTDLSVLSYEDHGAWESNAYGTGDESVLISSPGGRYYLQVCSYEGLASAFTLTNAFAP